MIVSLVLPALAALAVGFPAADRHRRLHPRVGARALAIAISSLALAAVAALGTIAIGFVAAIPWVKDNVLWCSDLARTHGEVPTSVGLLAVATLGIMGVSAARALRQTLKIHAHGSNAPTAGMELVDDERPDAYAIGGRRGRIVVTSGMLRLLEPAEQAVLVAHERSHLRHRHNRYTTLAVVAAAAVPPLRFVSRRLRLALERWADEDAAAEVGDRRLVAQALIRASLGRTDYGGGLSGTDGVNGLGLLGVPGRVEALLLPAPELFGGPVRALAPAGAACVVVVAGSAIQIHHLVQFTSHVCGL